MMLLVLARLAVVNLQNFQPLSVFDRQRARARARACTHTCIALHSVFKMGNKIICSSSKVWCRHTHLFRAWVDCARCCQRCRDIGWWIWRVMDLEGADLPSIGEIWCTNYWDISVEIKTLDSIFIFTTYLIHKLLNVSFLYWRCCLKLDF